MDAHFYFTFRSTEATTEGRLNALDEDKSLLNWSWGMTEYWQNDKSFWNPSATEVASACDSENESKLNKYSIGTAESFCSQRVFLRKTNLFYFHHKSFGVCVCLLRCGARRVVNEVVIAVVVTKFRIEIRERVSHSHQSPFRSKDGRVSFVELI